MSYYTLYVASDTSRQKETSVGLLNSAPSARDTDPQLWLEVSAKYVGPQHSDLFFP